MIKYFIGLCSCNNREMQLMVGRTPPIGQKAGKFLESFNELRHPYSLSLRSWSIDQGRKNAAKGKKLNGTSGRRVGLISSERVRGARLTGRLVTTVVSTITGLIVTA